MALLMRAVLVAAVVLAVSLLSQRHPRWGAVLLTLPLTSILAFALAWQRHHDAAQLQTMARETLVLVPLGLPFFVPLALAERLRDRQLQALVAGLLLAAATISAWLRWGPPT